MLGVLIGALITWLLAWYYYKRAGDELRVEADKLQHTNEMILRWLEVDGNNIKVVRAADGKPVSLARETSMSDVVSIGFAPTAGSLTTVVDESRS